MSSQGLLSHAEFLKEANHQLEQSDVLLVKAQIDNLSLINAQFGASKGDEVIAAVRDMLLESERNLIVGQVSTSLYACLCLMADDASGYIQNIENSLAKLNKAGTLGIGVDMSVGLVVAKRDEHAPIDDWVQKANKALMVSNKTGRATVYKSDVEVQLEVRALLAQLLITDAKPENFNWVYQPVVNLRTMHVVGYEALVRWDVLGFGLVSPELFIPIAEQMGVVPIIDRWAIAQAVEASKALLHDPGIAMGVNVSAVTLESDEAFVEHVIALAKRHEFGAGNLVLELTETAVIQNVEAVAKICDRLRSAGIQLSIDDFGKGETNLHVLSHLPVDYIKLDKSLLRLATPKATASMVKIGIEIAEMMNARVLCEGIETESDLQLCHDLGVNLGQGWYLGMPQPVSELISRTV